jgi:hypothetical protein
VYHTAERQGADVLKVLSIRQMITLYGSTLIAIWPNLQTLSWALDDETSSYEESTLALADILSEFRRLRWDHLASQAARLYTKAVANERGPAMMALAQDLREAFEQHMERDIYVLIPHSMRQYYEQVEPIFGEMVSDRIPGASQEIREAGKCFACERWTACVFHLMRALESSLHLIARELEVTFPAPIELQDWGVIVQKVKTRIGELEQQSRSAQKAMDLAFYSELNVQFGWFKNAWRNSVAHNRTFYAEQEAREILEHVGKFLQDIARRNSSVSVA